MRVSRRILFAAPFLAALAAGCESGGEKSAGGESAAPATKPAAGLETVLVDVKGMH